MSGRVFTITSNTELTFSDLVFFDFSPGDIIDVGEGEYVKTEGVQVVPIPGAVLLFGSGLLGLIGLRKKIKKA
jgi:hypothetical protein